MNLRQDDKQKHKNLYEEHISLLLADSKLKEFEEFVKEKGGIDFDAINGDDEVLKELEVQKLGMLMSGASTDAITKLNDGIGLFIHAHEVLHLSQKIMEKYGPETLSEDGKKAYSILLDTISNVLKEISLEKLNEGPIKTECQEKQTNNNEQQED